VKTVVAVVFDLTVASVFKTLASVNSALCSGIELVPALVRAAAVRSLCHVQKYQNTF